MPRDGGFHPFKGKVSRHFGDSVCDILFPRCRGPATISPESAGQGAESGRQGRHKKGDNGG
jgi:hypothetical protein